MPSLLHRVALPGRLLLLCLMLASPAAAQTAAPPATAPVPAAPLGAPTAAEEAFTKAVDEARQPFLTGLNEMVRGVARPRRAEALCRIVPRGRVENWTGKLVALTSSPGGRGVVAIEVAPKLTVGTARTDVGDEQDKTLIDTKAPLFAYASVLAVGDRVQFSGTLLPGKDDCFKEVGKDLNATMTQPEFLIRLDAIKKVVPPSASAVLSGQAPPMSIAQSSDYVRDAVDIIASAGTCGADNRRLVGVIIKVMVRAVAGQSVEQRDALISLMLNPPGQATQTKENCDSRLVALDRLETEAS